MLRVFEVPRSGQAVERPTEGPLAPNPEYLLWVDIEAPTREELERLREPFGLHPLAIEDCLTQDQRPKLEEYPSNIFVVIHELSRNGDELEGKEIHAFLGERALITVRDHHCRRVEELVLRVLGASDLYERGIAFVYYLLADAVASHNAVVLDELTEAIDDIEQQVLEGENEMTLPRIFSLKHSLGSARRALSPQRDLFVSLSRLQPRWVGERTAFYFRDVYDKLARTVEALESNRDLLGNVLEAHFSVVAQRTNDIVKRLTILSAIFLPLTFLTGFFGQNFDHLPFHSVTFMWAAFGCCIIVPPSMLFWFWRRGWL
ncbi:MAG TPA: magnesium transporter CorA family protein [Polyangiaceae bacterium]|nr:magnesium transporter CorA family protein [Polyangiaceae bacterium]